MSSEVPTTGGILWRALGVIGFTYMIALVFLGFSVEEYLMGTTRAAHAWTMAMWMSGSAIAAVMLYTTRDATRRDRDWLIVLTLLFFVLALKSMTHSF